MPFVVIHDHGIVAAVKGSDNSEGRRYDYGCLAFQLEVAAAGPCTVESDRHVDQRRRRPKHGDMPTSTEIMIAAPPVDAPFDPRELFAPGVPVEMEIGCGKGGFLLRRAQAFPHRAFLAVEWANKYYKFAADRMARWNISNVRIMRTDASHLVIHQLASNSLAALHLYHPDPWPKKRHHKRRLVQTRFADAVARCLVPDGLWWIQTDHAEYYEWIRAVLDPHPAFVEVKFETESGDALDPATNYQIKYVDQGREIHRAAYQRRPVPEAQKAGVGDAALRPPHSAFEEPTS